MSQAAKQTTTGRNCVCEIQHCRRSLCTETKYVQVQRNLSLVPNENIETETNMLHCRLVHSIVNFLTKGSVAVSSTNAPRLIYNDFLVNELVSPYMNGSLTESANPYGSRNDRMRSGFLQSLCERAN